MSAEPENNLNWEELKSFPCEYVSQPFVINNDEFMAASLKDGIYKFSVHKNEWIKIFDYDSDFKCRIYSLAYDNKHKLLYVCDANIVTSRMVILDLKTKNKITLMAQQYEADFGLIFGENKLHQICNWTPPGGIVQRGDHYIYDQTKQFQKITTFDAFNGLINYHLIYLKSSKCIFAFGGWKIMLNGYQNSIYRFS
eukprot:17554_1